MISLLLPTRGRPVLARRFLDSVVEHTADLGRLEVVLYVNEEDELSRDLDHDRLKIVRIVGSPGPMGWYNSACLARASGRVVMLANDDMLVRTKGWDQIVRELDEGCADGIYLAYGNDLFKGKRISTFPILSRKTCEILVTPYPTQYLGGLIDYHLFDIFKRLQKLGYDRVRYLKHLVFEHTHYRTGKVAFDETYRRRNRFADDATFIGLREQRQASARRLAAVIEGRPLPELPEARPAGGVPVNARRAVADFARAFLGDVALPLRWRLFLFTWYCGRYLAARRLLPS